MWNMWNCGSNCRLRNLVSLRWSCWNIWRGEQNPGTVNRFQSLSIAFNRFQWFGTVWLWKIVKNGARWDMRCKIPMVWLVLLHRFQWYDENCLRPWLYPSELLTTMSHTEQVKSLDENSCHKSSQVMISLGMESVFFLTAKASCQRLHL